MTPLLLALSLVACGGLPADLGGSATSPDRTGDAPTLVGTLVHTAPVELRTLHEEVVAPGTTGALRQVHLRAPFTGVLVSLSASPGDQVRTGQGIGTLRSWESVAALEGATALRKEATGAEAVERAERALALARDNDVTRALEAPEAGVVVSLATGVGERLGEGDEIAVIAPASALVFRAGVAQPDLLRVAAGQTVSIAFPGRAQPLGGTLRGPLPDEGTGALTVPFRVDLHERLDPPVLGLFGEAHITVGERPDVLVVPRTAVLTDDFEGTTRIATLTPDGHAHWVDVRVGLHDGDVVQVEGVGLAEGQPVVVSGQVGLAEGGAVRVAP